MARSRSKSGALGAAVAVLVSLVILALSFGLKALGDSRTDETARAAAGGGYSADTQVALFVKNSLPIDIRIDATVVDGSGWNGLKPTDTAAFADRLISTSGSHSADLVFATTRSKVPFTLTFATNDGTALGSVGLDRDYLKETCTSVKQGKYTVKDCSQVNVWWFADTRTLGSSSSCPSSNNSMNLAEYTDNAGKQQQLKFTLTCSSTTGATTGTLTQTAVPQK